MVATEGAYGSNFLKPLRMGLDYFSPQGIIRRLVEHLRLETDSRLLLTIREDGDEVVLMECGSGMMDEGRDIGRVPWHDIGLPRLASFEAIREEFFVDKELLSKLANSHLNPFSPCPHDHHLEGYYYTPHIRDEILYSWNSGLKNYLEKLA
jgi:hypothetical protein